MIEELEHGQFPSMESESEPSVDLGLRQNQLVREWRSEQFKALGYEHRLAEALSETQVDIWQVRHMIDKGCAPLLVLRILVGITRTGEEDATHSFNWLMAQIADIKHLAESLQDVGGKLAAH